MTFPANNNNNNIYSPKDGRKKEQVPIKAGSLQKAHTN